MLKVKRFFLLIASLVLALTFFACSKNENPNQEQKEPVLEPNFQLSNESMTLNLFESANIEFVVENIDNYTIEWTVDNESIVSISDGKAKAIGVGNTVVTAKIKSLELSDTIAITVNRGTISPVFKALEDITLDVGDTFDLDLGMSLNDVDFVEATTEFVTSGEVIEIDNSGKITALKSGTQVIKVVAKYNGLSVLEKEITVSVKEEIVAKLNVTYLFPSDDSITIDLSLLDKEISSISNLFINDLEPDYELQEKSLCISFSDGGVSTIAIVDDLTTYKFDVSIVDTVINTADEFEAYIKGGIDNSKIAVLAQDIDLTGKNCQGEKVLRGILDGQGHKVSNLYSYVGLFDAVVDGTLKNITFDNMDVRCYGLFGFKAYASLFQNVNVINTKIGDLDAILFRRLITDGFVLENCNFDLVSGNKYLQEAIALFDDHYFEDGLCDGSQVATIKNVNINFTGLVVDVNEQYNPADGGTYNFGENAIVENFNIIDKNDMASISYTPGYVLVSDNKVVVDLKSFSSEISNVKHITSGTAYIPFEVDGDNLSFPYYGNYGVESVVVFADNIYYSCNLLLVDRVISTKDELVSYYTNDVNNLKYVLIGNDIDLEGANCQNGGVLRGVIDGQGHKVSNFYSYVGMFDAVSGGTIKNITFDNLDVRCYGFFGFKAYSGTLENVNIVNSKVINDMNAVLFARNLSSGYVLKNCSFDLTCGDKYISEIVPLYDAHYVEDGVCDGNQSITIENVSVKFTGMFAKQGDKYMSASFNGGEENVFGDNDTISNFEVQDFMV